MPSARSPTYASPARGEGRVRPSHSGRSIFGARAFGGCVVTRSLADGDFHAHCPAVVTLARPSGGLADTMFRAVDAPLDRSPLTGRPRDQATSRDSRMFPRRPRRLPARTHGTSGAPDVDAPLERGGHVDATGRRRGLKFGSRRFRRDDRSSSPYAVRPSPGRLLPLGAFRSEPATWSLDWSLAAPPASRERFARQHPSSLPSRFPGTSTRAGVDRDLSGLGKATRPLSSRERERSTGKEPRKSRPDGRASRRLRCALGIVPSDLSR